MENIRFFFFVAQVEFEVWKHGGIPTWEVSAPCVESILVWSFVGIVIDGITDVEAHSSYLRWVQFWNPTFEDTTFEFHRKRSMKKKWRWRDTPPKTNISTYPLKKNGWKTKCSFWNGPCFFCGTFVHFQGGNPKPHMSFCGGSIQWIWVSVPEENWDRKVGISKTNHRSKNHPKNQEKNFMVKSIFAGETGAQT